MNVLRGKADDFLFVDQRRIYATLGGQGQWWAARCRHCGKWITKFDHSREDCERFATGSLHACPEHVPA